LIDLLSPLIEAVIEPVYYFTGRCVDAVFLRPLRCTVGIHEVPGSAKTCEHHLKVGFIACLTAGAVFSVAWFPL
jgi:hypothetical protein